ncbi:MAG TPA: YncE family protein [Candidatus Xenobia bacterium]|jgi:YVTN family beta-propeller protein
MKNLFILLSLLLSVSPAWADWHVTRSLPVPGDGGWDYLTFDYPTHRLFISRATHVQVLDVQTGKVVGDIADTPGVHGIALDAESGHGFVSCGKSDSVLMFDMGSLAPLARIPVGKKPDAIIDDPVDQRVFVMNGQSDSTTVIDPSDGHVLGQVPLGGGPEFAAADRDGHVWVNLEDESEVVEVDARQLKVLGTYQLAPGEHPTGLAIDPHHHRLYIGCHNQTLVVFDTHRGRLAGTEPIGKGVDACAFDPGLDLAFSSNGDGTLTVVDGRPLKVVANAPTEAGARTMALDTQDHVVYTCTAKVSSMPTPDERKAGKRPQYADGSFHVLVVSR